MFGVLVDVSGSMQSAYAVDRSSYAELNVERTHAVLTTIMNIVKRKIGHHELQESIFVCAFGLSGRIETCDLISLLEYIASPTHGHASSTHGHASPIHWQDGHQALIELARQHGAPHAERWIKKYLSQLEARFVYEGLRSDTSLIPKLIELIPSQLTTTSATMAFNLMSLVTESPEKAWVHKSEAYKFAHKIISDRSILDRSSESRENPGPLRRMQKLEPRPVQYVAEMLDGLLLNQSKASGASAASSSSESLHDRIQESIESIKPYIYGRTPMCKALKDAVSVFNETIDSYSAIYDETNAKSKKVLFILSDGMSTDGDPRPFAEKLHDLGVTVVTCFLTSAHIDDPKRLFDEIDPTWGRQTEDGRSVLFEISSTMPNTETPLSDLIYENWKLAPSGVSRLFIQVNSLDVVNEFCKIAVSQMTTSVYC